ncbi:MAG: Kazal-type serine protease inhibitor family protein [Aliihoeflea sp.]
MKFDFSGVKTGLLAVAGAGLLASCVVVEEGPRPLPPRPGPEPICTQQYDPVCGERGGDRQTFPNSCVARAEGYRIAYGGECRRGGGSNWDRPGRPGGPGWDRPGRPGSDRPGRPGPDRPQFCTREYAPVCAVQGNRQQTFGNACEAEAAGWRIRRGGEC